MKLKTVTPSAAIQDGYTVTITGTLPSGKSASITVEVEKDLALTAGSDSTTITNNTQDKTAFNTDWSFGITANQNVTWTPYVRPSTTQSGGWRYDYAYTVTTNTPTRWVGSAYYTRTNVDDGTTLSSVAERCRVTATTPGGQSITVSEVKPIN